MLTLWSLFCWSLVIKEKLLSIVGGRLGVAITFEDSASIPDVSLLTTEAFPSNAILYP